MLVPFVHSGRGLPDVLRIMTAGESHGPQLTALIEGLPSGLPVSAEMIDRDLARRQKGYGRGARMRIEADRAEITSGVRHGETLGGPVSLTIRNRDWSNWVDEMSAGTPDEEWTSARRVHVPRPGHADLAGATKYRHGDMRNILERSSARETAARVAVGAVCRSLVSLAGIRVASVVCRIGPVSWRPPSDWCAGIVAAAEESDVSCPDAAAAQAMRHAIDRAKAAGDTLGGVFEVRAFGVPPGLGSHVAADRRLDARLASALMSIPAIKGVEVGMGFAVAGLPGSRVHDPIAVGDGAWPFVRPTNNAGGVEGGTSNGEPIIVRAAMKPIPTLTRPLGSVDTDTMTAAPAHAERSDVCAVPAAAVVGEAEVCVELARALLDMFGSSHVDDLRRSLDGYRQDRRQFWLREDAG